MSARGVAGTTRGKGLRGGVRNKLTAVEQWISTINDKSIYVRVHYDKLRINCELKAGGMWQVAGGSWGRWQVACTHTATVQQEWQQEINVLTEGERRSSRWRLIGSTTTSTLVVH